MDYKKYLKYKNKYIQLKHIYGGMFESTSNNKKIISNCDDIITFYNSINICWFISVLIILIYGDSTGNIVQYVLKYLINDDILNNRFILVNNLLEILLENNYNKELVKDLIVFLCNKFLIKFNKVNTLKQIRENTRQYTRQNSLDLTSNISNLYRILLYNNLSYSDETLYFEDDQYTTDFVDEKYTSNDMDFVDEKLEYSDKITYIDDLDNYNKKKYNYTGTKLTTGYIFDIFFITNIFSSILLNKFIKFNIVYTNDLIDIKLIDQSIGIILYISHHYCCFFKCNNKLMYSSNTLSFKYNWIKFINKYNELINNNIEFKIYFNDKNNDIGPIIITKNNHIYNYINSKTKKSIIYDNYDINHNYKYKIDFYNYTELLYYARYNTNYTNLYSFIFLSYYNDDIESFKLNNIYYYLNYYIASDNYIEFKKVIDNYNDIDLNSLLDYVSLFYYACIENRIQIVQLLLEIDRSINYNYTYSNYTLFYTVCEIGNYEIIKLLLESDKIIYTDYNNNNKSPFYLICENNNIKLVELFLETPKDLDYNLQHKDKTPFYLICENNNIKLVELLLETPKDIHYNLLYNGQSPFFVACANNNFEVVKLLLETPKDIHYNLLYIGQSPFYVACSYGNYDIVKLLLETSKDIHYNLLYNGQSPFFVACSYGNYDIVKLLLETSKDIHYNLKYKNRSPYDEALKKNFTSIINLLETYSKIHLKIL